MPINDLTYYSGNNVQKQLLIGSVTVTIPATAPFTPVTILTVPTGLTYVPVARMTVQYGGERGIFLDTLGANVSAYIDPSFNFVAIATSGAMIPNVMVNYRIYSDQ